MSRIDDANARMMVVSREATAARLPTGDASNSSSAPAAAWPGRRGAEEEAAEELANANARARLIADIGRLIRDPTVPEVTRVAGLTLIGWLARRRPDEPAHAVGVEEARRCERRGQAGRVKAR